MNGPPHEPETVLHDPTWTPEMRREGQQCPQPGDTLGTFHLEEVLGEGGQAWVFSAHDLQMDRKVAVKVFRANTYAVREARHAAPINHEHVIRIHQVEDDLHGWGFVVMELCAEHDGDSGQVHFGRTLQVEAAGASVAQRIRWVEEAARGVAAAHRIGILHCDLKPSNILVRPVSRSAAVTDFGVGLREVERARAELAGTPPFWAPELLTGDGHAHPTQKTDVYALGVTLYVALTGKSHAYATRTRSPIDWVNTIRSETPEAIEGLPPRLARIVGWAMARDPAARCPSAKALADALEAYRTHRTTVIESSLWLRLRLWTRRHPLTVGNLLLGALAVGLLSVNFAVSQSLEATERDLGLIRARHEEARTDLDNIDDVLNAFRSDNAALAKQLHTSTRTASALVERVDVLRRRFGHTVRKKNDEISELERSLAARERKVKQLSAELEALRGAGSSTIGRSR